MQTLSFRHKAKRRLTGKKDQAIIGVVASGNLEVLLERVLPETACEVDIITPLSGYDETWKAVVDEFVARVAADNRINASLAGNPYPVSVLATDPRIPLAQPTSLEIRYAGDAPGFPSGVIQVNFVVPSWAGASYEIQIGNASTPFTLFARAAPGS